MLKLIVSTQSLSKKYDGWFINKNNWNDKNMIEKIEIKIKESFYRTIFTILAGFISGKYCWENGWVWIFVCGFTLAISMGFADS